MKSRDIKKNKKNNFDLILDIDYRKRKKSRRIKNLIRDEKKVLMPDPRETKNKIKKKV